MAVSKLDGYLSSLWTTKPDELKVLAELTTNIRRVQYALDNHIFDETFDVKSSGCHTKNAKTAGKLRTEGNRLYKMKKYKEALAKYNESILMSPFAVLEGNLKTIEKVCPTGTPNDLALSFSNRSAVLYELKEYENCLIAIEYSVDLGYPIDQLYKLYDREARCHMALSQWSQAKQHEHSLNTALKAVGSSGLQATAKAKLVRSINRERETIPNTGKMTRSRDEKNSCSPTLPQLVGDPNSKFPAASSLISVELQAQMGRSLVAEAALNPGDVLLSEKPYVSVLYPEYYKSHCSHCHMPVSLPYPCRQCTDVVYCGRHCASSAWPIHSIECGYLDLLCEDWLSKLGHVALRAVLSAPSDVLLSTDILIPQPDLNEDVLNSSYSHFCQFITHEDQRDSQSNIQLVAMAVYLTMVLRKTGFLHGKNELIICQHIIHALQAVQCNGVAITQMSNIDDFHHSTPENIGQGVYPTVAFANHSCNPDAELYFYGNQCVVRAIKVVRPGTEVCYDYGPIFTLQSKSERQHQLQSNYFFMCQCVACKENWPMFEELNQRNPIFKCERCGENLSILGSTSSKQVCAKCKQKVSIVETIGRLASSHDVYTAAANDAFRGKISQALPCLLAHLCLMDEVLSQPWKEYYGCQATIKQCYRLLATQYQQKK